MEVSEFVEALRGKGETGNSTEDATEEAADILLVLGSVCEANGICMDDVLLRAAQKIREIERRIETGYYLHRKV